MRSRLRRMRQKRIVSVVNGNWFERARMIARNYRTDWIKSKSRWFVSGEQGDRVKANFEVERSIGRVEPELWRDQTEAALRVKLSGQLPKAVTYERQDLVNWRHSVDPMLAEEQNVFALAGGKESDAAQPLSVASSMPSPKRLRLLEIRNTDDIVATANELVRDIQTMCEAEEKSEATAPRTSIMPVTLDVTAL